MMSCLILLALALTLALDGVDADLLVVLLESGQVLTGLGELALLHTLTDIPVDERTLGIHEIELVVETSPGLGNGRGVAQHAHGTLHLGQVAAWHDGRWLVVDANLEAGRAPVDELDGTLGLDGRDGSVDVLGHDVTTVQHTAGHVLAVTRVALDHLVGRLEHGVGDLGNGELLVVGLLGRDDRRIGGQREVDTRVRHQVGLELGQVDVEGTIESERGGDRAHDLGNQTVQVGVGGSLDVQVTTADVVDGLVVDHERAVGVLQGGVGGQDRVVWLNDSGRDLRGRVDGELELGLLAVVDAETLHQERGEAGAGATAERVEDEEALETSALIGQLADAVQHEVDDLLADGVVAASVVVGGVLLAGDELLGVEELTVGARAHLVNHGRLEVDEDGARHMLASASLAEERVE